MAENTDFTDVSPVGFIEYAVLGGSGAVTNYVNIVWDPGGGFVQWTTTSTPDSSGSSYPDPYGSGFGATSDFQVLHTYTS
jgi:hypothetical protein